MTLNGRLQRRNSTSLTMSPCHPRDPSFAACRTTPSTRRSDAWALTARPLSGTASERRHGTILDEVLGFRPDIIEHQLAHAVKDPNGRAYNRTAFLPQRREMMQTWFDYLDGLRSGAKTTFAKKSTRR